GRPGAVRQERGALALCGGVICRPYVTTENRRLVCDMGVPTSIEHLVKAVHWFFFFKQKTAYEIPVFCYHHKLDPVGACRLCLVDFSPGPPRPQTACTTPVAEGMVVRTQSAMAVQARADILEFELVNHPLDCPVCDKGGECPLQDFTFRHGYPT